MKKILSTFIAVVLMLASHAQSTGYNPQNPPDPMAQYVLQVICLPENGGKIEPSGSRSYDVGAEIRCSATASPGYTFRAWMSGEKEVSKENYMYFTMPAHDEVLIALFDYTGYNPDNPGDPADAGYSHMVTVSATPSEGGAFNNPKFLLTEGESARIFAYPSRGFRFASWKQNGQIISLDNPLEINMGLEDVEYTATFVYDPANPANPGANMFDSFTGQLIIDDFEPGRLSTAIYAALESPDLVSKIKICGVVNAGDLGFPSLTHNAQIVDMSRTTGMTAVPSWMFEEMEHLESVVLPSTVEEMGHSAFYGCSALREIKIYAYLPPKISDRTFDGMPSDIVVKVPSGALSLYQKAQGWQNYTILPLDEEMCTIEVCLPADAADGRYKGMTIQLKNTSNGQLYKYLVTERTSYVFQYLVPDCEYMLTVVTPTGKILGTVAEIFPEGSSTQCSLTELKQPATATVTVQTEDGTDITALCTFLWTDTDGNIISRTQRSTGILEGDMVKCTATLRSEAELLYQTPEVTTLTVAAGNNTAAIKVKDRKTVVMSGTVRDSQLRTPLSDVAVCANQTISLQNQVTRTTTTDRYGKYKIEVYEGVPINVSVSYGGYNSLKTDVEATRESIEVKDMYLEEAAGSKVYVQIRHKSAGNRLSVTAAGEDNDITFDIRLKSSGKVYRGLMLRQGKIILPEYVDEDEFTLTARSIGGRFEDTGTTGIITSGSGKADIVIGENGSVSISYAESEGSEAEAIIFGDSGSILRKGTFRGKHLTFDNIPSGTYKVVCFVSDASLTTATMLSQLADRGLVAGQDYIERDVVLKTGENIVLELETLPRVKTQMASYVDSDKTAVSVSKTSLSVGQTQTVRGVLAFVDNMVPEDLYMKFHIPEGCSFVENSLLIGNIPAYYTLEDGVLYVRPEGNGTVRFCIVPTSAGEHTVGADVCFIYDGRDITSPMRQAGFRADELAINVPSTTTSPTITVTGQAPARSEVEIYDNGMKIGSTEALYSGTWTAAVTLDRPYVSSLHRIQASIATPGGNMLVSECKECFVEDESVVHEIAKSVEMSFYQPEISSQVVRLFNHEKGTSGLPYTMFTGQPFTFIADFGCNSPDFIEDAYIYVYTNNNEVTRLKAHYQAALDRWAATGVFYDENSPVNATARAKSIPVLGSVDHTQLTEAYARSEDIRNSLKVELQALDDASAAFDAAYLDENVSIAELEAMLTEQYALTFGDDNYDVIDDKTYEEILLKVPDFIKEAENTGDDDEVAKLFSEFERYGESVFEYDGKEFTCRISHCSDLDDKALIEKGYRLVPAIGGETILLLEGQDEYDYIDFNNDYRRHIFMNAQTDVTLGSRRRAISREQMERFFSFVGDLILKLSQEEAVVMKLSQSLDYENKALLNDLLNQENLVNKALAHNQRRIDEATDFMARLRAMNERRVLENGLEKINRRKSKALIVSKHVQRLVSAAFLIRDLIDYVELINNYGQRAFALQVPPMCDKIANPEMAIRLLEERINTIQHEVFDFIFFQGLRKAVYLSAELALAKIPFLGMALSYLEEAAEDVRKDAFIRYTATSLSRIEYDIASIQKKCKDDDDDDDDDDDGDDEKPRVVNPDEEDIPEPVAPDLKVAYDPSGYVYEAVESNRLEGVVTTVYYQELSEDIYGDIHKEAVLWNASEFGQENPLITDRDGLYAWDVPKGLWQVKYEKEGYETAYSEWLPVPPPQLEVNVGMTQYSAPEIVEAKAYPDAVTVVFDKYMNTSTFDDGNVAVTVNGEPVKGCIRFSDVTTPDGSAAGQSYGRKMRFEAQNPFDSDEVLLTISRRVQSYAGIPMPENFSQTFTIEPELREIAVDELLELECGQTVTLPVGLLPDVAGVDRVLEVISTSPLVAATSAERYESDENGMEEISLSGFMPGKTTLILTVLETDIKSSVTVNVVKEAPPVVSVPVASVPSGSVIIGTEVFISCDTPGAIIYYTLDGSCPCDAEHMVYDGNPIILTEDTTLKIMAVAPDMEDSEVVTYLYTVAQSGMSGIDVAKELRISQSVPGQMIHVVSDDNLKKIDIYNMDGRLELSKVIDGKAVDIDISCLRTGAYVMRILTQNAAHIRKLVK